MKSIGNGWKRAQEAKQRAKQSEFTVWAYQQQFDEIKRRAQPLYSILGDGMRAMSPEAMQEKAEREAPLMRDIYAHEYAFTPAPTNGANWSTWQRIKRALRAL